MKCDPTAIVRLCCPWPQERAERRKQDRLARRAAYEEDAELMAKSVKKGPKRSSRARRPEEEDTADLEGAPDGAHRSGSEADAGPLDDGQCHEREADAQQEQEEEEV